MKSIIFTHFKEKLLNESKKRTFRCLFIPTYDIKEIVNITWKEDGIREVLYIAKIINIYPKQIKDVTDFEAILDGFINKYEFRKGLMEINHIRNINRWGFFTVFDRIEEEI